MEFPIILNLISTTAIVCSVIFAGIQVRNAQKQRANEASSQLIHSIVSTDFSKALRLVLSLPDGLSKGDVETQARDQMDTIFFFLGMSETLGIFVHRCEIKLDLVDDLLSGPLVLSWRKLGGFVTEYRKLLGRDTMYEWYQWLVERMIERESKSVPVPAYLAHRNWHD